MCWISWSGPYNKKEEKEKNAGDGDGDGDGRLAGGDRERNQKAPTNQRWSPTGTGGGGGVERFLGQVAHGLLLIPDLSERFHLHIFLLPPEGNGSF